MSNFYIAIVSHGHFDYITKNKELLKIGDLKNVKVIIKDNIKDSYLEEYAKSNNFEYITSKKILGFGENNNFIFNYSKRILNATGEDWLLIFNPDVVISVKEFERLMVNLNTRKGEFFAPNLFKNNDMQESENSLRYFPKLINLFNPLLLRPINSAYDKSILNDEDIIEWASGAFLCVKFQAFELVNGFDENYFMYYEDVDFCYRLNRAGIELKFLKSIKAVHQGEYKNRSIFSKHFMWYLNSLFRFLFARR